MSDALARNTPKLADEAELLSGNCLAHGRRQFVEVVTNFPEECSSLGCTPAQVFLALFLSTLTTTAFDRSSLKVV